MKLSAIQPHWSTWKLTVYKEIDGLQVCVEAAVCKSLPVSVLLGTDVPEQITLLSRVRSREDSSMAVVTRSKF